METADQYSAFASPTVPKKPERPRTGYIVMEVTDEVMSFLKIREKREGKCTGGQQNFVKKSLSEYRKTDHHRAI
jgi:hypothetical protein